jgi:hypothetical protein
LGSHFGRVGRSGRGGGLAAGMAIYVQFHCYAAATLRLGCMVHLRLAVGKNSAGAQLISSDRPVAPRKTHRKVTAGEISFEMP